ncbi:MAG: ATP-binding protein [Bryobacteraceae bacterium]|jgi:hypothetical protein
MQAASKRAETIEPSQHLVQFYEADPAAWAKGADRYLADGLKQGEACSRHCNPGTRESYQPATQCFSLQPRVTRVSWPGGISRCRLVEQATNYLEQAIHESGASITAGPLPCVVGNQSQLTGLMQNLLGNAIKYRGREAVRIEVTAEPKGSGWTVNGTGIAPAYHQQIFGLFKRLHQRSVPGTGIIRK